MILVDSSLWVEHLRNGDPTLVRLLEGSAVLGHPWVAGELALGHLSHRQEVIGLLGNLPQATVATNEEVMSLIDQHRLYGRGIGIVDAQLLAATLLSADAALWTMDRPLAEVADQLGCAFDSGAATAPIR